MGLTLLIIALQALLLIIIVAYLAQSLPRFWGKVETPFIPTRRKHFAAIARVLDFNAGDRVYELGSGDGRVLRAWAERYPHTTFVGIERNLILYYVSKIRSFRLRNITFRREDFFKSDLRSATHIYIFILPTVMDALLPKLQQELVRTRLVSSAFRFRSKAVSDEVRISEKSLPLGEHTVYVYEFARRP